MVDGRGCTLGQTESADWLQAAAVKLLGWEEQRILGTASQYNHQTSNRLQLMEQPNKAALQIMTLNNQDDPKPAGKASRQPQAHKTISTGMHTVLPHGVDITVHVETRCDSQFRSAAVLLWSVWHWQPLDCAWQQPLFGGHAPAST